MIDFWTILAGALPIYVLVVLGMGLRRWGVLTREMERGVFAVAMHCFYPALIIDKMLGSELVRRPEMVGLGIGVGAMIVFVGMMVSYFCGGLLKLKKGEGRGTFALSSGVQNFGYLAVPILIAMLDESEQDNVLGLLFVHSLGVELVVWTVGVMLLSGKFQLSRSAYLNGPVLAVVMGLFLSYSGIWRFFESSEGGEVGMGAGVIRQVLRWLGDCAFPVALILIGAMMWSLLQGMKMNWRVSLGAVLLRSVLLPLFILSVAYWVPMDEGLQLVLVVQAAMPAAMVPVMLAQRYEGRPEVATEVVLATSLVALVTIPLWVSFGMNLIF